SAAAGVGGSPGGKRGSEGTAPAGDATRQETPQGKTCTAGHAASLARRVRGKGKRVSKPPAAAGGIRRAATREAGTRVTIDGQPVNLVHLPGLGADGRDATPPSHAGAGGAPEGAWRSRLPDVLEFARRQLDGESEVDQFGFDPEFNSHVLMPVARVLYQRWFGVRMRGLAHVPEAGPALVVANHSGTLPVEAGMLPSGLPEDPP